MNYIEKLKKWFSENNLLIIFVAIYSFIITMQNVCNPISQRTNYSDGAIYQYIGHLITIGKVPYVDAFDHKGPLLYIINAIGCLINVEWGIWLTDFIFMMGIMYVSYKIANAFISKAWSLIICIFIFSDFSDGYWIGNTPDFYATFFVALSIYILLRFYLKGLLDNTSVLIVGICCACTFWLKQTTIISIVLLCFFIIIDNLIKKKLRDSGRYIVWFGIGFFIPTLIFCAWIWLNNAWADMISDFFTFNFGYTNNSVSMLQRMSELLFLSNFSSVVFIWILITFVFIYRISNSQIDNKLNYTVIWHTIITLVLSLVILSTPGRNYSHYNLILYPLLIAISASIIKCLQESVNIIKIDIQILVIVVSGLMVIPNLKNITNYCLNNWNTSQEDNEVLNYIKLNCQGEDKIAVATPDNCGFYLESGFESATTYPYIQADMYNNEILKQEYRLQIQENIPKVIVWPKNRNDVDFLGDEILENYYSVGETENFKIYKYIKNDVKRICKITDINEYLDNLKELKNCSVFFAIKDIQGYSLTNDIVQNLVDMGFSNSESLLEHEYHSFLGIYSNGKVIYQNIGSNEAISYLTSIEGVDVNMKSELLDNGNMASICLNGIEYAINERGINIVVMDNSSGTIIDSVTFDTHVPEYTCYR